MERIYRDRLNKLCNFIENLPRSKFNLSIIARGKLGAACGTVGCAIGWMPAIFPKSVAWRPMQFESTMLEVVFKESVNDEYAPENFEVAQKMFGLTEDESYYLFDPTYYVKQGQKTVVNRIRKFIKDRTIDPNCPNAADLISQPLSSL